MIIFVKWAMAEINTFKMMNFNRIVKLNINKSLDKFLKKQVTNIKLVFFQM